MTTQQPPATKTCAKTGKAVMDYATARDTAATVREQPYSRRDRFVDAFPCEACHGWHLGYSARRAHAARAKVRE